MLLSAGCELLTRIVPGWETPNLEHPYAEAYDSVVDLQGDIVPGDQVMVKAPSGYYHHGIFVGKQHVGGKFRVAVVDFRGADKESATIGVRTFHDFVNGATVFAKANYPQGAALQHESSARLALAWAEAEKEKPTAYNLALNNCEVFATMCRCMRCAVACHEVLLQHLVHLPVVSSIMTRRGVK
jgi:hypothetical protein